MSNMQDLPQYKGWLRSGRVVVRWGATSHNKGKLDNVQIVTN